MSPKPPVESHVPISVPLTESVMSLGQSAEVPGTSELSSITNSMDSMVFCASLALLGNWYSRNPRVNQISPAFIRSGSRKVSGTSSRPIMPSVEQSPQGADTSQLV
ncbi:hypothetical protein D3C71_1837980 [compost metagenome]